MTAKHNDAKQMTNLYGLIGHPLTHSFSQRYFTEKFAREGIANARYELFDLPDLAAGLPAVLQTPNLRGLNVTIPYKQTVMPYLDRLDASAQKVGAVNVIRLETDGSRTGYNSDYYGFRQSLVAWLAEAGQPLPAPDLRALVLGTGGAAKAVIAVLTDLGISFRQVSRNPGAGQVSYGDLPALVSTYHLIINSSPAGTFPNVLFPPDVPYQRLTARHFLYDLVYNPAETRFMALGRERGATVMNGLQMLELQAEKAWEIWNSL
jgi:shikimate dehydrogenase